MTRNAGVSMIQTACRVRERWRYIPLPDSLKEIVNQRGGSSSNVETYDFGELESSLRSTWPGWSLSGVGISTQYGKWLQEALAEGSWLKTSPIMSQYRAKGRSRVDVEAPALVPPLEEQLLEPSQYNLLWAKKWKNPDEHIGMKEGRVMLSSLKRTARVASLFGMRKLTLSDNLPMVLCFEKGRSSKPGPNRLCRAAGAIQAGVGLRWRLRHVETKRNTADEPSRWFQKNSSSRTSTTSYKVQLHGILFPQECGEPELSEVDYDDSGRFQAPGPSRAPSSSSASPPSASCPQKISFSRNACQKNEKGFCWEIFSGEGNLTNMFRKLGYTCV